MCKDAREIFVRGRIVYRITRDTESRFRYRGRNFEKTCAKVLAAIVIREISGLAFENGTTFGKL